MLSPGQTITTCQPNTSQHMSRAFGHRVAMCCDMLSVVNCQFEPTTPNASQHVATGWPNAHNMLHPTMLLSFGRGFIISASSQNFAVNSPPKNKRRFAICHEQNNLFHLNLTSGKHRHRHYIGIIQIFERRIFKCQFLKAYYT